jgi:ABC-2 type transport system permease protein
LARLGTSLRFTLRHNRARLIVWLLITVGMIGFIGAYYASLNPDALRQLIIAGDTVSMKSLLGWITVASSATGAPLGAAVWIKSWMFVGLMVCIGMVFLVTHNLRADEDAGRTELFRSRPLGLHSTLASTLIMSVTLVVIIGVGIAVIGVAQHYGVLIGAEAASDPDSLGSWVFGASIAALGLLGIGVGVLANEVMPTSGAANGLGAAIIGVFYLIRMGADVQDLDLAWISPIGWAEKMDPWGDNRMWPLALVAALALVLVIIGWIIESRRDYAGSLFASRLGHPDASPWTTSVTGLAIRLQRTAWISWAIGVAVFAVMLGSITPMMADMFKQIEFAGIDPSAGMLAAASMLMAMICLGVSSFALYSGSSMALDDAHGLLEQQLAGSVSRVSWALRRIGVTFVGALLLLALFTTVFGAAYCATVGDWSDFGKLAATCLAYIPSVLVLIGVVVLGFGWWPRQSVAVSWGAFGAMWFIMILGEALKLPEETYKSLPFLSVSNVPADEPNWTTLIITLVVSLGLVGLGLIGLKRRNIPA